MWLMRYLGAPVRELLTSLPHAGWQVTRSVDEDRADLEVRYEFEGRGVEVVCDSVERILIIFLHRGDGEALSEIPFSSNRRGVLARYGTPTAKGEALQIPNLGDYGAWDRFALPSGEIHFRRLVNRVDLKGR